jgi:hypothetical protein
MASGPVACAHHEHEHHDPLDEPCSPDDESSSDECEGGRCVFGISGMKISLGIVPLAGGPMLHVAACTQATAGIISSWRGPRHELGPPDLPLAGRSQALRI